MTPPKKKEQTTVYIEIGPNLSSVLQAMINKVYEASSNPDYYAVAFEPIYNLIKKLIPNQDIMGEK